MAYSHFTATNQQEVVPPRLAFVLLTLDQKLRPFAPPRYSTSDVIGAGLTSSNNFSFRYIIADTPCNNCFNANFSLINSLYFS